MQPPRADAIRFSVEPRDVPAVKAARRMHMTLVEFEGTLPRLIARGFLQADPDIGRFDLKAIDAWMDRRSGLAGASEASDFAVGFEERLAALCGRRSRKRPKDPEGAK